MCARSFLSSKHTAADTKPVDSFDLWRSSRGLLPPPGIILQKGARILLPKDMILARSISFLALSLWAFFQGLTALAADLRPEEIVTVLPKDAIPAILSPSFDEGRKVSWLRANDFVVGVEVSGDSRAYPVPTLSRHEIINDKVGGIPIAVTW